MNPLVGDVCHRLVYGYDYFPVHHERKAMLQEVSGDIFMSRAQAIAHGVAPNDGPV